MSSSSSESSAQGFLLLSLPEAELSSRESSKPSLGPFSLVCVTLATPVDERDVWLVLQVGANEFPIIPSTVVRHSRSKRQYTFEDCRGDRDFTLSLSEPRSPLEEEDQRTIEVVFSQYVTLIEEEDSESSCKAEGGQSGRPPPLPPRRTSPASLIPSRPPPPYEEVEAEDLRNRLVLVDENSGEVLGSLASNVAIREDANVSAPGHEKDPVVVDIPDQDQSAKDQEEAYIHVSTWEESDPLMRTATLISHGIIVATNAIANGLSSATSYYTSRVTPSSSPLQFSESTHGSARFAHRISGRAVHITSKTVSLIDSAIERGIEYVANRNARRRSPSATPFSPQGLHPGPYNNARSPSPAPQLPPRRDKNGNLMVPVENSPVASSSNVVNNQRPSLMKRLFISADLLASTLEESAVHLVGHGGSKITEAVGHTYGKHAGEVTHLTTSTLKNVILVYVDAQGVGRKAMLRKAGKSFVKAKLGNKDVVLGVDNNSVKAS